MSVSYKIFKFYNYLMYFPLFIFYNLALAVTNTFFPRMLIFANISDPLLIFYYTHYQIVGLS